MKKEERNTQSQFDGPYMVQDRDHMSETAQSPDKSKAGRARQSEQSQSSSRQQGGSDDRGGHRQQG